MGEKEEIGNNNIQMIFERNSTIDGIFVVSSEKILIGVCTLSKIFQKAFTSRVKVKSYFLFIPCLDFNHLLWTLMVFMLLIGFRNILQCHNTVYWHLLTKILKKILEHCQHS